MSEELQHRNTEPLPQPLSAAVIEKPQAAEDWPDPNPPDWDLFFVSEDPDFESGHYCVALNHEHAAAWAYRLGHVGDDEERVVVVTAVEGVDNGDLLAEEALSQLEDLAPPEWAFADHEEPWCDGLRNRETRDALKERLAQLFEDFSREHYLGQFLKRRSGPESFFLLPAEEEEAGA